MDKYLAHDGLLVVGSMVKERMKTRFIGFLLTLAGLGCSGASPISEAPDGPPRILVLSSTIGYIEPCGCTVDLLLGGIDRIAATVAAERAKGPTAVVVVGPHLFEKDIPAHRAAQEEAKAALISRAFQKIGVDAVVPTDKELLRGAPFYANLAQQFGFPDVTANVPQGQGRVIQLGNLKLGVLGVVAEGQGVPKGTGTDPFAAATAEAKRLRAAGAHVVLGLSATSRRTLRKMAKKIPEIDLWALGDHPKEAKVISPVRGRYVIESGDRGRHLGRVILHEATQPGPLRDPVGDAAREKKRLDLQLQMRREMYARTKVKALKSTIATLENKIAALSSPDVSGKRLEYTLIPMTKSTHQDPIVERWVSDYNTSLKALNLASAGTIQPVPEGGSGYAGIDVCADCHPDTLKVWRRSLHALAWETLEADAKTFDAECVGCHVTGWQKPGGSILGKVKGLEDVQCEVCHGPGALHAELGDGSNIVRDPPESLCVECHNAHHSPKFDFERYRPKILGPGHGKPLASTP